MKGMGMGMKNYDLYKIAIDTRNFEIHLFWQRSNYFLVLNTAIAVAFFSVDNWEYNLIIAGFGILVSILWFRINLGGKFWQSRWEGRLSKIENAIANEKTMEINLFSVNKETLYNDAKDSLLENKERQNLTPLQKLILKKPSVSLMMILLSFLFFGVWLIFFGIVFFDK